MNRSISHYYQLVLVMTEKELRARYKYTIFGFFWLVLNPVLQMIIISFVFQFINKNPVPNYNYFLFIGLLFWNFFSLSLSKATPSMVFERDLIKKARFNRSVIPISIIISNLFHLVIALVLYLIIVLAFRIVPAGGLLILPAALLILICFTIGISLITTALNVRFRDINFFVQAFLIVWFYATPVIYPLTIVPQKYLFFWRFNPITSVYLLLHRGLFGYSVVDQSILIINIVFVLLILTIGIIIFAHESKNFDDWV